MKKMIFGFILGIVLCGGIVYAANYQASDIIYIKDGTKTTVNEAINDLYDNQTSKTNVVYCGSYTANGSFDITTYGLTNVDVNKFIFVPSKSSGKYGYATPAHIGYGYNKDYVYVRGYANYVAQTFALNGNTLSFTLPYVDAVAMNGPEAASANVSVGGRVNLVIAGDIY